LWEDLRIPRDKVVLGSPKFLVNTFIAGYGLPKISETATGQAGMDESALATYAERGNAAAPLILAWRKTEKAKSTYVDRLLALSKADGRVHGNIHLNGTSTGRTSSSDPNLQNTPYRIGKVNIKKIYIPSPLQKPEWWDVPKNAQLAFDFGWDKDDELVWVDMDFKGAEVRILSFYAPDKDLLEALREGLDIHSWMTAEIHGHTYEDIEYGRATNAHFEELRSQTKRVVFGTIYGISAKGLHARMGFDEEWAQELIDKLMDRFPGIKQYIKATQKTISRQGCVVSPYGRFRRFPMVGMGRWIEGRNHRQGVNYLIQSYCSDIVLSVMINLGAHMRELLGRLLFTVHDSVCWEMPKRLVHKLASFLEIRVRDYIAAEFPQMPVTMPYDVQVGASYGEKIDLADWLKSA
jgi:DNA polymerase-1